MIFDDRWVYGEALGYLQSICEKWNFDDFALGVQKHDHPVLLVV